MMLIPKRIKIDAIKDENGNVVVIVADENIDKGQRAALMEAIPVIAAMPFDGSFEAFLVGGDIVIEGKAATERRKRVEADGELAEKINVADIKDAEIGSLHANASNIGPLIRFKFDSTNRMIGWFLDADQFVVDPDPAVASLSAEVGRLRSAVTCLLKV